MFPNLNDRQSAFLENKTQRLLRAVERARSQFLAKSRSQSSVCGATSGSYLDRLPLELIISIFGYTEWRDVVRLRMVCSAFKGLVDAHEHVIVGTMIRFGGADMTLLTQLFLPPKARDPQQGRKPNLMYLHSLERRNRTCSDLAYSLASRADKKDFETRKEQAIEHIQRRLLRQLYYVEHFLINTRLYLSSNLVTVARENTHADGPPTAAMLTQIYREVQESIVTTWSDGAIISTHHAFHFLVNTVRLSLSPEPPHNTNDDTVSVMLRCTNPLQRCSEFFAADSPGSPSRLRKKFMMDMQDEKEKAELLASVVFGGDRKVGKRRASGMVKDLPWAPRMGEVWFEVARNELRKRGLEQHAADGLFRFPEVQGEVMIGCPGCQVVT
ncbi:hypothetical protein BZA05DRAFT_336742 [Tricharina praecox]|uniref:uncharacterized protein n=1 Tax=Tricharina praecox TaxID=43433 RepID=UPI00221FD9E7|nr:uncharacterized protein BZA05DRAFT_336742 [Tricharina praecox]KAI5853384.1 hypothetical protein BZA05DRAFT_336742 [Tricharina praecox]